MTEDGPRQLILGIQPHDDATLENFYVADQNKQVIDYLSGIRFQGSSPLIYLWGTADSGRSHLLQAMCHQANALEQTAIYIPLTRIQDYHPDIFEGIAGLALVCLDDVDQIAGNKEWEQALFHAYNGIHENQGQLIVAADSAPASLRLQLNDLQSRLSSGIVFQMPRLDDTQKLKMLQFRAEKRGMKLTDKVARFILYRADRSVGSLMNVLAELDRITLEEKRRLTIPLIKQTLGW